MKKIITSESVNIGHPDKTCDVIADAFLDEALKQDAFAQMAVECAIKDNLLMIYGEATTFAKINYSKIAKNVLKEVGYKNPFKVIIKISEQSSEINNAVVQHEFCANDQGIVYGYACDETKEFMPLPIMLAHKLMKRYNDFIASRKDFFSDAKSQVSVLYDNDIPKEITTILISASHAENLTHKEINNILLENVIKPVIAEYPKTFSDNTKFIINPSGRFTIWGSFADSGCVGRKIVVDSYGGVGRVGGGCFSSKNATKVDRSAAYYSRYVAKNIVARGYAKRCEIQVSYAIGQNQPMSLYIETFGTNNISTKEIEKFVAENFNFSPSNIIKELDLLKPIYKATACFGHFGRKEFAWEKIKQI